MPIHWKDLTDDEMLNFEEPQTAVIARYDRIMQKHATQAMLGLKDRLTGLGETIYKMHLGLSDKADEAFRLYERGARAQAQQQRAIRMLTWVIALSTVAYTGITAASVWATFQSNNTQRESLELQRHPPTSGQH